MEDKEEEEEEKQLDKAVAANENESTPVKPTNQILWSGNRLGDPLPLLDKDKYASSCIAKVKKPKTTLIDRLRAFKYKLDHICQRGENSDSLRCMYCDGSVEPVIFTNDNCISLHSPYEICGVDYLPIFIKKMESANRERAGRFKRFYTRSYLPELRQIAFFQLLRQGNSIQQQQQFAGLDELCTERLKKPVCLADYEEKLKPKEFEKISLFGDFENANISAASIDVANTQLMILLRSDTNTKGCLHWFQFVVVAKQPCTMRFTILNNKRSGSFFKDGMKIAVKDLSNEDSQNSQDLTIAEKQESQSSNNLKGWTRKGEGVFYSKSNVEHAFYKSDTPAGSADNCAPEGKGFQTLDFNFKFERAGQRVVLAYCYPYTLTDLISFLRETEGNLRRQSDPAQGGKQKETNPPEIAEMQEFVRIVSGDIKYKRCMLGHSRLGLPIYQLKIAAFKRTGPYRKRKRKVIYIVARQHPGESTSSFVCQGMISFLLSNHPASRFLRSVYVFKIIPMINPDGVVLGNSRCNLSGFDLNRSWQMPTKKFTPEIYFAKEEIKRTQLKREVIVFCDLHGHSQGMGFFMYGCDKFIEGGGNSSWTSARLLPHILVKRSEFFNIDECRYKVTEDRASTARVTAWAEMKIPFSFTIETSFYGYYKAKEMKMKSQKLDQDKATNNGQAKKYKECVHFTINDLLDIGKSICFGFLEQLLTLEKLQFEQKCFKIKQEVVQATATTEDSQEFGRKHPALSEEQLNEICPGICKNWRDYFDKSELEKNFNLIQNGEDPNELESEDGGSDSEHEADLFQPNEWPFKIDLKDDDQEKTWKRKKNTEQSRIAANKSQDNQSIKRNDRYLKEEGTITAATANLPLKKLIDLRSSSPQFKNTRKPSESCTTSPQPKIFSNEIHPVNIKPSCEGAEAESQRHSAQRSVSSIIFIRQQDSGKYQLQQNQTSLQVPKEPYSHSATNSLNTSFVQIIKSNNGINSSKHISKIQETVSSSPHEQTAKNQVKLSLLKQKQLELLLLTTTQKREQQELKQQQRSKNRLRKHSNNYQFQVGSDERKRLLCLVKKKDASSYNVSAAESPKRKEISLQEQKQPAEIKRDVSVVIAQERPKGIPAGKGRHNSKRGNSLQLSSLLKDTSKEPSVCGDYLFNKKTTNTTGISQSQNNSNSSTHLENLSIINNPASNAKPLNGMYKWKSKSPYRVSQEIETSEKLTKPRTNFLSASVVINPQGLKQPHPPPPPPPHHHPLYSLDQVTQKKSISYLQQFESCSSSNNLNNMLNSSSQFPQIDKVIAARRYSKQQLLNSMGQLSLKDCSFQQESQHLMDVASKHSSAIASSEIAGNKLIYDSSFRRN